MGNLNDSYDKLTAALERSNVEDSTAKKVLKVILWILGTVAVLAGIFWGIVKPLFLKIKEKVESAEPDYSNSESDNRDTSKQEVIITDKVDKLTEESYTDFVGEFAKELKSLGIDSDRILAFCSLENVYPLVKESPELAKRLYSWTSKEQFLNDALSVVSAVELYDALEWEKNRSTDGFLWISSSLLDERDRQGMLVVEDYICEIAKAVKDNNNDLVNSLVSELLTKIENGDLSRLSDGWRVSVSTYLGLLLNGVAKDNLNKENRDRLTDLQNISDVIIRRIYETMDEVTDDKSKTSTKGYTPKFVAGNRGIAGNMGGKGYNHYKTMRRDPFNNKKRR